MLPRKVLFSSLILLILVSSLVYAQSEEENTNEKIENNAAIGDSSNRIAEKRSKRSMGGFRYRSTSEPGEVTDEPSMPTETTTGYYQYKPYDPKDDSGEYDGYGKNRPSERYGDGYGNNGYRMTGEDGIDSSEYGQDFGDFGPVYSDKDSMYASMNIWVRSADDWDRPDNSRYRKKYRGNKYNKDKGYKEKKYKDNDYKDSYDKDDNDYKKNDRKKRSYSRVQFPVRHFKDIRKFPRRNFPSLISIFPWLPIFYDKITYQTCIFSPTGGMYILPPLINFYGQRFAVAQLIKWGYASLVSSGAPPPPNVNVAPLVQPAPAAGPVPAGVAGASSVAPAPKYDSKKSRFLGGVQTDFPEFKPRYSQNVQEGGSGYGNNRGVNRNTYGTDSNYGGTGRQEVYPQGGPQTGGNGYN